MIVPFIKREVECDQFKGMAGIELLKVCSRVVMSSVSVIMKGDIMATPMLPSMPVLDVLEGDDDHVFSLCTVTRSMFRAEESRQEEVADMQSADAPVEPPEEPVDSDSEDPVDLRDTFMGSLDKQLIN